MKITIKIGKLIFTRIFILFLTIFCIFNYSVGFVSAQGTNIRIKILPATTITPTKNGGGGGSNIVTSIMFAGSAYPSSRVGVLKDGRLVISTVAGPDGKFNITLSGISSGNYLFSLFGEDSKARRSSLFTFPVFITKGATTQISGIFIPPTIGVDKSAVIKGDNIVIFGQSKPEGDITISVHSPQEFFLTTKADKYGSYLYTLDTTILDFGDHITKSKVTKDGEISNFGNVVGFNVGNINVPSNFDECAIKGELNRDCKVNLLDFSILAFWYLRSNPPSKNDLNGDGKIDLIDFSILAYNWTG